LLTIKSLPDRPLASMPRFVIWPYAVGCGLALIASLMALVGMQVFFGGEVFRAWMCVDAALIWIVAAWVLTRPVDAPEARLHGLHARDPLRRWARWSQFFWLGLALCNLVPALAAVIQQKATMAGAGGTATPVPWYAKQSFVDAVEVLRWAPMLAGACAHVLLCIILERLAQWVRDDRAEFWINLSMWAIPALVLAHSGITGNPWMIGVGVLSLIFFIGSVAAILALPIGLYSLTTSLANAGLHTYESEAVEARRRERSQNVERRIGARVDVMKEAQRRRRR